VVQNLFGEHIRADGEHAQHLQLRPIVASDRAAHTVITALYKGRKAHSHQMYSLLYTKLCSTMILLKEGSKHLSQ
jgi:hypothetical protein